MNGRISDGGVWASSEFNRQINCRENVLNLPANPVFIGDGAFPLKSNLMKPYSGTQLSHDERLFNYRLSRTHRIVENVFAQSIYNPANKFLCCCIQHNYLKTVYDCDEEEFEEINELSDINFMKNILKWP